MQRLFSTALLLLAVVGAADASVCVRGGNTCCVGTASLLCVTPAATSTGSTADACCAPVIAAQSSIAPAQPDKNELPSESGAGHAISGASHSICPAQRLAAQPDRAFTAGTFEAGQTIYLRTGRLRL